MKKMCCYEIQIFPCVFDVNFLHVLCRVTDSNVVTPIPAFVLAKIHGAAQIK